MKKKNMLFVLLAVLLPVVFLFKILLADTGKPLSKPISPKSAIQNLSPTSIGDQKLSKAEVVQRTRKLQMPFIANEGQTDERVMFYANTFGGTVFVTKNGEIVYSLPPTKKWGADVHAHNRPVNPHKSPINKGEKGNAGRFDGSMHHHSPANSQSVKAGGQNDTKQDDGKQGHSEDKHRQGARGVVLKEEIVDGWIDKIKGEKKAITTVNDLRGSDPSKWKTNIQTYDVVTLGEVYDGIELKLKAYGNNVEKLFYVKPGADPTAIKLKLSGAKTLKVNEDGLLEAETALGIVKFTKPIVYQESKVPSTTTKKSRSSAPLAGKGRGEGDLSDRQYIEAAYVVIGNEYSFKLEDYDRSREVVIDPLLESTYLGGSGGSGADYGNAIAIDSGGNIYVTGSTGSPDFPTTPGAYDTFFNGSDYAFVSKLNSDLTSLLASTYLGGVGEDYGNAIAIDSGGNIYVTGSTGSTDFPTTPGAYNTSGSGFVSRLSNDLTSLLASTYLGNAGTSIAIDTGGNIYVGGGDTVFKLNGALTSLLGSTSLSGGSISATAIDSYGNVYVTGSTGSSSFPTTSGVYDDYFNGGSDVFVSKLNSALTSLLASTYLGGDGEDSGNAIAIDSGGNIYVTGSTGSTDFPTTPGAYDTYFDDYYDFNVFVSKINSDLTTLLSSTYLEWVASDAGNDIAIDSEGNVYITGGSNVLKLTGDLTSPLASKYLGGGYGDSGGYISAIAIDSNGNIYLTGSAWSSDFPTTPGAYDTSFNDGYDVFVSKLNGDLTNLLASTYLGGSSGGFDYGTSVTIDSSGNVYVAGSTSTSGFPTTSGVYDTSFNGGHDAFVSKLSSDLTNLLVSTYLGGSDDDYGNAIALDASGNVYVTGETLSSDFPTTPGAYNTSGSAFLARLSNDLTNLLASTYLGSGWGSGDSIAIDSGGNIYVARGSAVLKLNDTLTNLIASKSLNGGVIQDIAIGSGGNIYVAGSTSSPNFPTTTGAYDTSYNGSTYREDAFVSKLSGDLASILASTYLGGTNWDYGRSIVIDSGGNVYVAGWTNSADFPTTASAYDTFKDGWTNAFVSKLSGDLTKLLASTYLGGSSGEFCYSLTIDSWENVYVAGSTSSSDFPTTRGAYDTSFNGILTGNEDAFVSKLNSDLTSLLASTYLGGASSEFCMSIAIAPNGDVYVTGATWSSDFPTTTDAYDPSLAGYSGGPTDAFVSKFDSNLSANPVTVPYVSLNLAVDGNLDESAWNIATDVSNVVIGTTNNTATFGVLWDNTYLYVGVKVLDDTLYNDSTSVHENDSVEIYIDGDHNHGTTYDSYDRQFIKGWNDETLFEKNGKKTDVLHAWATITGGYSIELAIPWSNLGITPTAGMTIGFSVGYNDDDDWSGREGQVVWIGTANNYLDTSALGDIVLGEAPAPSPEIINDLVAFKPVRSTYQTTSDTTGCGDEFVGQFSFDATLKNKRNNPPLTDLVMEVVELTNNNVLQNADGVPGGVGARLTVPNIGDYADGVLSPGESVDVSFIICLTESKSFGFVVDVLGIKEGQTDSLQVAELQSTDIKPGLAKFGKGSGLMRKGFFRRFHP